ncbi:MAG TPA: dihydrodipicolinate synthase family protein [Pseudacidobacterium sp.]|jgi:dihydrodipicolinate synthase/N-acetylneuraminate lyase|nr:dihydrodipicolinate synthase family protein [Pseudacidobacterium sp.]
MLLEGIFPAITTPFHSDGRLYLHKLAANVEHYSRAPIAGLTILGSTGEAVMLDDEESREVLRSSREAASPEKVLLAGVGRESVVATLRLAEFAAEQQYDAVLVRTPNYYGPQMRPLEMLTYFRMVADRSPLPVVLYNISRFTNYEMPVELVAELAQHPNIIGIKDSSGSIERISQIVAATRNAPKRATAVTNVFAAFTNRMSLVDSSFVPADILGAGTTAVAVPQAKPKTVTRIKEVGFQVLSGSSSNVKESLDAGASGAVLAFGACAPQACQEIYMAWKDNDPELAALKQARVLEASRVVTGRFGIPGIKFACDLNGYYGGYPRVPLLPLNAEEQAQVTRAMADVRH